MNETSKERVGATLVPALAVGQPIYFLYWMVGFNWRWDTFDQTILAAAAVMLLPPSIRDVRALYHNWVIVPRERAWAAERSSRQRRRSLTQEYLRTHRER